MVQHTGVTRPARQRGFVWMLALLAGCASTPPSPAFDRGIAVLARSDGATASAVAVAESVNDTGADFVLVEASADSAWFTELAERTGLQLSGPSIEGGIGFAYLAPQAPLGDTTIAVPIGSEEAVVLHDALYELGEGVLLDIIAFRADLASDPHALVKAFLRYVATDVMTNVPLVLGVQADDAALADSIEILLRPSFVPPTSCATGGDTAGPLRGLRLFVGTPAQIRCEEVEHPSGDRDALLARLVFQR